MTLRTIFCCCAAGAALLCLRPSLAANRTIPDAAMATLPLNGAQTPIVAPIVPAGPWTRPQVDVPQTAFPPKIDGNLDDACWVAATHAGNFYRWSGSAPVVQQTEAWICADKTHLYVAFHCQDSEPSKIRASQIQRNGDTSNDDIVELDIDSQNTHRNLSWFTVTPRGTQYEHLEGGTADNITWVGDWKTASRRTKDGWTAEIAIPFALMRYPKDTHSFGVLLFRKLARETTFECWPYVPPGGDIQEAQYMSDFIGIAPPFIAPRPIFLPYVLASAGDGTSSRQGMDIKYPLSTTLTGVASIFPDFKTVEQDVQNVNFSYTERYLSDHRPFFAEGSGFLPYQDLFYSRRIGEIDGGLKVVGKQDDTSIGMLATTGSQDGNQKDVVLQVRRDLGLYNHLLYDLVQDYQAGKPSNVTMKFQGGYGWRVGQDNYSTLAVHMPSWEGGQLKDSRDYFNFSYSPKPGRLGTTMDFTDIGPNFISNLGYNPDLDIRGPSFSLFQNNQFDRGPIEYYSFNVNASTYQHHTGGFFRNDTGINGYVSNRSGYGLSAGIDQSQRDTFHDHVYNGDFSWGGKTLFQRGDISESFGEQEAQTYRFLAFNQGVFVSRLLSTAVSYNHLDLGGTHSTQSVVTANYRLNAVQVIGGRIVTQDGATNIYLSFSRHVPAGTDLFVLIGDPNSGTTRGLVTVKVVSPF